MALWAGNCTEFEHSRTGPDRKNLSKRLRQTLRLQSKGTDWQTRPTGLKKGQNYRARIQEHQLISADLRVNLSNLLYTVFQSVISNQPGAKQHFSYLPPLFKLRSAQNLGPGTRLQKHCLHNNTLKVFTMIQQLWHICIRLCVCMCTCMYVFVVVVQSLSHVQLFCDPTDCSKPGSSVHGILQARILDWVAISYSGGSSQPRGWTCVSPALAGRFFSTEPSGKPHVYVYIYINSFIPYNSPMIAVPFCTVLICNHLLKVTHRRLKINMQIQAYFPLHPVLLAIVLTAGLPLSGENSTAAYVVWLQGIMGKSSLLTTFSSSPSPNRSVCFIQKEQLVERWKHEMQSPSSATT